MANKSVITETILPDDQQGYSLKIEADSQGYLKITMTDGQNTVSMKLNQADATALSKIVMYVNQIRQTAPG